MQDYTHSQESGQRLRFVSGSVVSVSQGPVARTTDQPSLHLKSLPQGPSSKQNFISLHFSHFSLCEYMTHSQRYIYGLTLYPTRGLSSATSMAVRTLAKGRAHSTSMKR